MNTRTYTGWIALGATLLLWGIVAYSVQSVEQQKNDHADLVANVQQSELQTISSTRLHGLMVETQDERASLQAALPTDIVTAVDAIDAAGKTAGVDVQISDAQPESPTAARSGAISAVAFMIQSQGSFAQVTRLIVLLNALSIPTYIEQMDLTQSGAPLWNLTARIRVLTMSSTTP